MMLLLILDVIKSPSKITFSNTVAKISFCPEMSVGISLSQIGQMQNKIYNNKRFIICIAFASLIVLGTSAIIGTCSSITLIISISILCFLQASSIDTLQKTFNFSFLIILYRYFGVSCICFLFAPTELLLCLYIFTTKSLFS